ncbi:hypothetical protein BO78DRAFT_413898 [Aspergillus sclerotiicarbonarius CBS 121057]|uniref:SNF2 N-terminal domain-containing protein n=1 Tax=Aspergillus sclerotiicarbonarius (strain CBS 121057 / IBT 28362) TaxID=1448318 RepID=A0A319F163_ASPSB|nr:hypothetical protein BO78DRAFT_413898 [Aspergillus sclerotiicarbonarius CBS 121057]
MKEPADSGSQYSQALPSDEGHYMKTIHSRAHQVVTALDADHVWILSATPLFNRVTDLGGYVVLLWPKLACTIRRGDRKNNECEGARVGYHVLPPVLDQIALCRRLGDRMVVDGEALYKAGPAKDKDAGGAGRVDWGVLRLLGLIAFNPRLYRLLKFESGKSKSKHEDDQTWATRIAERLEAPNKGSPSSTG